MKNNYIIIVAAGKGKRFGLNYNKLLYEIGGKPLIYYTLKNISSSPLIKNIILVTNENDIKIMNKIVKKYNFYKVKKIIKGGKERQDSVYNGLKYIKKVEKNKSKDIFVGIHDGARINIKPYLIEKILKTAQKFNSAAAGIKIYDTVKKINNSNFVIETIPRENLILIQTPQFFKFELIYNAYTFAYKNKFYATDDVAILEFSGLKTKIVEGDNNNIKITFKEDIDKIMKDKIEYKVGYGYDVHKFIEGRKLYLGGIKIKYKYGLKGHSDADVLIHSIIDALLGAASLRDIGYHFPDTDKKYKNINSLILLKNVKNLLEENNFKIINIDSTIILEKPKLKDYIPKMKKKLCKVLDISEENLNIKATTTEGLGFTGRGEGIAVSSISNLKKFLL